ncbi:MAG: hypothetical protein SGI88_08450, partial [Candidatus Hydrogenedentes bacterium]|nr:hypothetical protein [Candidatus Hydrogenedentota bacterium]
LHARLPLTQLPRNVPFALAIRQPHPRQPRAVAEASEENAERAFGLYERSRALSPDEDGARLARVRLAYREGKRNISRELRQRQAGVKRMADAEKRFGELVEEGDDSEDAGDDP